MSPTLNAPWIAVQTAQLLAQRGHAWLLSGPSGLGQYDLALSLVTAWLCEKPGPHGACGVCGSCHAIEVRTHADLCVLMPETVMLELGWPLSEKAQDEIDKKTRKPSREIRVDAMRDAVEFSQRTNARGQGKAVLVFPAERMNNITANALLKTLEEPPGDVKFVLATEAAHQLLPTIRSRCLGHTMFWPDAAQALSWLAEQGVPAGDAEILLHAAGGRPADVLRQAASGQSPVWWASFPQAMARGDVAALSDLSPSQSIEALQKLCHDLVLRQSGAQPRFFSLDSLPGSKASLATLTSWYKRLTTAARSSEHPFNAGLMLEALASEARLAITAPS
jgi:DNA polymerase-3 subunit delta'